MCIRDRLFLLLLLRRLKVQIRHQCVMYTYETALCSATVPSCCAQITASQSHYRSQAAYSKWRHNYGQMWEQTATGRNTRWISSQGYKSVYVLKVYYLKTHLRKIVRLSLRFAKLIESIHTDRGTHEVVLKLMLKRNMMRRIPVSYTHLDVYKRQQ